MTRQLKGQIALSVLLAVAFAALLPITQDEAYYWTWGQRPAFGYFDHPPGVAWLTSLGRMLGRSEVAVRLGTILANGLTLIVLGHTFCLAGLNKKNTAIAVALVQFSIAGLGLGFLTTPDSMLALCWALALHEATAALIGQRWRWLSAGVFTGLGLLGKFTMVLIGPVFLIGMLGGDRKALRTLWPYAGGILALFMFAPNILWNHNHDWVTWRFQFRHGFSMDRDQTGAAHSVLQKPLEKVKYGPEAAFAKSFRDLTKRTEDEKKIEVPPVLAALRRLADYPGGQLGLWGGLCFALGAALYHCRRDQPISHVKPEVRSLFLGATWFPLIFFALVAVTGKVEANWPAMHILGAAPILAGHLEKRSRWVFSGALANIALMALLTLHGRWHIFPAGKQDRVLKETHGYAALSDILRERPGHILADSYQLVAMLRYYLDDRAINQWPGITRASHYLLPDGIVFPEGLNRITTDGLWLITTDEWPPRLASMKPTSMYQLRDCRQKDLEIISVYMTNHIMPGCKKALHVWYLIRYEGI